MTTTPTGPPKIFSSEGYRYRTRYYTTGRECVVCGKPCKPGPAVMHCRASEALSTTPIPLDIDAAADGGHFPVGSTCALLFPPGYLTPLELCPDEDHRRRRAIREQ